MAGAEARDGQLCLWLLALSYYALTAWSPKEMTALTKYKVSPEWVRPTTEAGPAHYPELEEGWAALNPEHQNTYLKKICGRPSERVQLD